jgi:hypothetical protein
MFGAAALAMELRSDGPRNLVDETKVIAAIDRGEQALRIHGVEHEGRDR